MRGILGSVGFTLCLSAVAQWTPITVSLPTWHTFGNYSNGPMLFTAPGIGFAAQSTYVSPSTGYFIRFVATEDEWATNVIVQAISGGAGSRPVTAMWRSSDRGCFYRRLSGGTQELKSFTRYEGTVEFKIYPVAGGVYDTLIVAPTGETSAYALTHRNTDELVLRYVQPNTYVTVTGLPATAQKLHGIHFFDDQTGAVLLRSSEGMGEVWVTSNAGQAWSLALSDEQVWFKAMKWLDDRTAWLLGDEGRILVTTDAGGTWSVLDSPAPVVWRSVDGYSTDHVWIAGGQGKVFSTQDGGSTWTDHSMEAEEVIELMTYDQVVYARARVWLQSGHLVTRIFRWGELDDEDPPDGTPEGSHWWVNSEHGIQLILAGEDEAVRDLQMYDRSGREVRATRFGDMVPMEHLPAGVYLLRMRTDQRTVSDKVFWKGRP
jgi:hypothetical protein